MDNHSDYLRAPESVCKPDVRSPTTDFFTGQPLSIADQHREISEIRLNKKVPDTVQIQFETTKNLYLYAWFVYRFYPVAKHQAYICLELALRERFADEMHANNGKKGEREFGPGLKRLLKYAVNKGYLKDENFKLWQHHTEMRARQRTENEVWKEAREKGLTEIRIDNLQYEIKDEDRDHKYLESLIETMPLLRNNYAHGSSSLDKQVLGTISLVAEIINQIY